MVQLRSIKLARSFDGAAIGPIIKLARPFNGAAIYGVASLHVLLMVQLKLTSIRILLLHVFSMALTIPYS